MIDCTSGWRTTSASVKRMKPMPSTPSRTASASIRPLGLPRGRSICVTSPVTTAFESIAEAREEHLHLLGGRVLRLVEDHEGVVQRAAAHEGERRHLDHAALDQALRLVEVHHVVERVVERAQVGVHLLGEVAGQEAELLARLDRGPRQDHARPPRGGGARRPPSPSRGRSCRCRPARPRTTMSCSRISSM